MTKLKLKYKYIAIDFDGTIATVDKAEVYPGIGELILGADVIIRMIKDHGGKVAIWTCRCGTDTWKVQEFLQKHDIPYDVFNNNFPEIIEIYEDNSRKISADVYIDDKSIHCKKIDWLEISNLLFEKVDENVNNI